MLPIDPTTAVILAVAYFVFSALSAWTDGAAPTSTRSQDEDLSDWNRDFY